MTRLICLTCAPVCLVACHSSCTPSQGVHKETLLKDTRPAARAPWEKEVEVEDKENEETISIALLFELEAK